MPDLIFAGIQVASDHLFRCAHCIFDAAKDIQWRLEAALSLTYSLGPKEALPVEPLKINRTHYV